MLPSVVGHARRVLKGNPFDFRACRPTKPESRFGRGARHDSKSLHAEKRWDDSEFDADIIIVVIALIVPKGDGRQQRFAPASLAPVSLKSAYIFPSLLPVCFSLSLSLFSPSDCNSDSFEWGICANMERISSISANDAVCILIWQSNNAATTTVTVTQREGIPPRPTEWRSSALFRGPIISNIYRRLPLLNTQAFPKGSG